MKKIRGTEMMKPVKPTAGTLVTVALKNSRQFHGTLAKPADEAVLQLTQTAKVRGIDRRDVAAVFSREWCDR